MNTQRRSVTSRQTAERTYPYRVDVPVPPFGLGMRLDAMLEWCTKNLPPDAWAQHGWSERRGPKADPRHWVRFYFFDTAKAEMFGRRWGGHVCEPIVPSAERRSPTDG